MDLSLVGSVVDGKYRVEGLLGRGGMGAVFRAVHLGTDRTVALKVIVPDHAERADFLARFEREARACGRLRHPNIVDVTDFGYGEVNGRRLAYLVMEYLDGCSLADVLRDATALPIAWVVDVLQQVGSALEEAHRAGILHRDLKPDNIWLEPNRRGGYTIKVLDFGLAKLGQAAEPEPAAAPLAVVDPPDGATLVRETPDATAAGADDTEEATQIRPTATPARLTPSDDSATEMGSIVGTPAYMSPEQALGRPVDGRSDLYSVGTILFEMLTGRVPFDHPDPMMQMRMQAKAPPPRLDLLAKRAPWCTPQLEALVDGGLIKEPDHRYPDAATMIAVLLMLMGGVLAWIPSVPPALSVRFFHRQLPTDCRERRTEMLLFSV
jgi:serine/threonine protein kinase